MSLWMATICSYMAVGFLYGEVCQIFVIGAEKKFGWNSHISSKGSLILAGSSS